MQLRWEETEQVGDVLPDFRELDPVLLQGVGVDDRQIDAAQIEQRIHVLGWAARDDGQDMQVVPVIDDSGHLRRQTQRRAFDQAGSEADGPGVNLSLLLLIGQRARRRSGLPLRIGFDLQRQDKRSRQREQAH